MTTRFTRTIVPATAALVAALSLRLAHSPAARAQAVDPKVLVAQIDTNCAVFAKAIRSEPPSDVVRRGTSLWKIASDGDVAVAEKAGTAVTYAKVWKQAGNYVWAHVVTRDSNGDARATQLCFRADGSLARVRQATTISKLDGAAARTAYYGRTGTVIAKGSAFSVDDPAIYTSVRNLPFFKILP